jgi:CNT family concentrative nucleoside transporter
MPFASQLTGLMGIAAILAVAWLMSRHKRAIDWRTVVNGLCLQTLIALFVLHVPAGQQLFHQIGQAIEKLLSFSDQGAGFVFGPLVTQPDTLKKLFGPGGDFIFAFKLVPTIVFVSTLVSMGYHLGWIQRMVQVVAWVVYRVLGVSGSEAVSNVASIFVGQIEAQLLVRHYVPTMTQSELLAVMAGSLACIASGIMAVYIQMGIPAEYLLTASLMAVPGALVISKLVLPETEPSETAGTVKVEITCKTVNLIDAAAHGAADGLRIGLTVTAMLIGFIALIGFADFLVGQAGHVLSLWGASLAGVGLDLNALTLKAVLGKLFQPVAGLLGVPWKDAQAVGSLMGTKLVLNEFVAYADLHPQITQRLLDPKSVAVASIALCGFANFSSVAMQIGGIGEMAPNRKADLARLGLLALACGTMASYVSAALAGILFSVQHTLSLSWTLGVMAALVVVMIVANLLAAALRKTPVLATAPELSTFRPLPQSAAPSATPSVPVEPATTSEPAEGPIEPESLPVSSFAEAMAAETTPTEVSDALMVHITQPQVPSTRLSQLPPLVPMATPASRGGAAKALLPDERLAALSDAQSVMAHQRLTVLPTSPSELLAAEPSGDPSQGPMPIWRNDGPPTGMTPQFPPPFPALSRTVPPAE